MLLFRKKICVQDQRHGVPLGGTTLEPSATFWCQEARSELCRRSQRAAKVATLLVPYWTCGEYMAQGESGGGNAETRGRRAVRLTLSQWSSTSSSGFARLANMK